MAIPEGYTALAKIGISYKGEYSSAASYGQYDAVYYNGSTYVALIDSPVGNPMDDNINWKYLAKGFEEDKSNSCITDTDGTRYQFGIDSGGIYLEQITES